MANNNQRVPAHRTCGAAEVHHRLMESREYQANRINIERHTARFMLWGGRDRRAGLITVPTVVHVVYGDSTQSISDAQVQSQIDVFKCGRIWRLTLSFSSRLLRKIRVGPQPTA